MGYLSSKSFSGKRSQSAPPEAHAAGGSPLASERERGLSRNENEKRDPASELQVPSPGHRKQRGKKRWPGNENEDYAASEGDPSS
jgi:hypothetical protein